MRDAWLGRGDGALHLGANPYVVGLGILGRREFGLDRGEFGHGESVADGRGRANPGGGRLVRYGSDLVVMKGE